MDTNARARELRRTLTPAEELLWERLRDRGLMGLKFRRQSPVSRYIPDFCCRDLRLVIELDGGIHDTKPQAEHDQNRDGWLRALGYVVLRFPNNRISTDLDSVLGEIARAALRIRPNLRSHPAAEAFLSSGSLSPSPGEGVKGGAGEGAGG